VPPARRPIRHQEGARHEIMRTRRVAIDRPDDRRGWFGRWLRGNRCFYRPPPCWRSGGFLGRRRSAHDAAAVRPLRQCSTVRLRLEVQAWQGLMLRRGCLHQPGDGQLLLLKGIEVPMLVGAELRVLQFAQKRDTISAVQAPHEREPDSFNAIVRNWAGISYGSESPIAPTSATTT
jgi:hypothetical protein